MNHNRSASTYAQSCWRRAAPDDSRGTRPKDVICLSRVLLRGLRLTGSWYWFYSCHQTPNIFADQAISQDESRRVSHCCPRRFTLRRIRRNVRAIASHFNRLKRRCFADACFSQLDCFDGLSGSCRLLFCLIGSVGQDQLFIHRLSK